MKIKVGKKLLNYDFEESKWVKAKIIHIDHEEGMVVLKRVDGKEIDCEISDLKDPTCFKEK